MAKEKIIVVFYIVYNRNLKIRRQVINNDPNLSVAPSRMLSTVEFDLTSDV